MHNSAPLRAAVVEDAPDIRQLMADLLRDAGHDVVAATDGTGLDPDELVRWGADLLVLDLRLIDERTQLTGWELLQLARAHEGLARMAILVCTADLGALKQHRTALADMADVVVLTKPFTVDEFDTGVAAALDRRPHRPPGTPRGGQTFDAGRRLAQYEHPTAAPQDAGQA